MAGRTGRLGVLGGGGGVGGGGEHGPIIASFTLNPNDEHETLSPNPSPANSPVKGGIAGAGSRALEDMGSSANAGGDTAAAAPANDNKGAGGARLSMGTRNGGRRGSGNIHSGAASTTAAAAAVGSAPAGADTKANPATTSQQQGPAGGGSGSGPTLTPARLAHFLDSNGNPIHHGTGTGGCLTCLADDDHANLLLCERCNDEYHTYCCDPPLQSVPEGDWFCDKCKPFHLPLPPTDQLSTLVSSLPPTFTSRFGEIVWAAGGVGFGWWPACIYDPRLTVGGARTLAQKNLGKKHLVYFFECHDAPFTVLGNAKLCPWEEGLLEEYDLGKTAKSSGKNKTLLFERALQSALLEVVKPMDMRMEWNHANHPNPNPNAAGGGGGGANQQLQQLMGGGKKRAAAAAAGSSSFSSGGGGDDNLDGNNKKQNKKKRKRGAGSGSNNNDDPGGDGNSGGMRRSSRMPSSSKPSSSPPTVVDDGGSADANGTNKRRVVTVKRTNVNAALQAMSAGGRGGGAIKIEPSEQQDGRLYCKILRRFGGGGANDPRSSTEQAPLPFVVDATSNVGFVTLPSRHNSTFADARLAMESDLDDGCLPSGGKWKFYIPKLGPVSVRQETKIGPMLEFLKGTTLDARLGDGVSFNPLKIVITKDYSCK